MVIPVADITRKSAELSTENTGIGETDHQNANPSFIPTKGNHLESFFLGGISPLKVYPP